MLRSSEHSCMRMFTTLKRTSHHLKDKEHFHMTIFHVVNEIQHAMTWNDSKKTVQKFIYINKIIPWLSVHDIRTRPYMVIIWSSAHTITNYQFISMNTNNAVGWDHLFSRMNLHLYSQNPPIFVLKLCRVSPTINDTCQNMKRAEYKSNVYLIPVNIMSNLCSKFGRRR